MQPASNSRRWLGGAIALVGGAVTAVGAFLPWVSVHLGQLAGNRSLTVKGTSSTDGKVALAAGIVLLIAGAAMWAATPSARRGLAVLAIVAGLVGGGIALFDVTTKDRQFDDGLRKGFANVQGHPISNAQLAVIKEQLKRLGVSFSLSSGLYIALVGGVIGLIGGIVGLTTPAPAAEPTDSGFGTGGGYGAQGIEAGSMPVPVPPPPGTPPPGTPPPGTPPIGAPAEPQPPPAPPGEGEGEPAP